MKHGILNGKIKFRDTDMDFIRFGTGERTLIMLPGLGDGLRTIRGMALPFSLLYREFGKEYTVWSFSRKNKLVPGTTTEDMARDLKRAMDGLGIGKADVYGVSMGGMIAQHLAADYPEKVGSLILAVTAAHPNDLLAQSVTEWVDQAKRDDHAALMDSNLRLIYSEGYYRKNRWMTPIMGKLMKPDTYDRFFVMAQACMTHDAWEKLPQIQARTLVVGGEQDRVLGADPSREIASRIPGSTLVMYEQWGHGVYEEEKGFNRSLLEFLRQHP